jgi:hypothetical protein
MSTVTVNMSETDVIRSRQELASYFGSLDAKRPTAWVQYGYKTDLTFQDFLNAYERTGAGFGAVHRILDGCWQELPRIKTKGSEDETPWEKKVKGLFSSINAWGSLKDFDRRNLVGRFSALIYRVADGRKLHEELGSGALVDVVPLFESQIKVTHWNVNESSPDYGKPLMFQYETSKRTSDDQAKPSTWINVHPSRVQILAEGSTNGDFLGGVPLLKAGFNALVDIEKVSGGSGESFLKNSARTISFEYDVNSAPSRISDDGQKVDVKKAHEDQVRKLNQNIDSAVVTQGGKTSVLQTSISDPTKPFEVAANLFAASVRLPFTIVFGQQTGRLASDQDNADANKRYGARREFELTPMLTAFIQRMQACGAIDKGEFEIEWPPLGAPTDEQKTDLLDKYTRAMKQAFDAGLAEPLFDVDELRAVVGFKPRKVLPKLNEGNPGAVIGANK